jgi:histidyl-tRNA synthetase
MEKPSLPKGTRDFGPAQMARRQYLMETIRQVFKTYGFLPLETPAMENLSTLTGKYGDEGDQLLFRILNSGDFLGDLVSKSLYHALRSSIVELIRQQKKRLTIENLIQQIEDTRDSLVSTFGGNLTHRELELFKCLFNEEIRFTARKISNICQDYSSTDLFETWIEKLQSDSELPYLKEQFRPVITLSILEHFRDLTTNISEKGLRYDLTVPFARYVVMNRHDIALPFKRYQMQPVWRADRPQKGRYREFYQCDADVVGTDSLICEAEIIGMITEVFAGLNLKDYTIKINHRGVLSGLAELAGVSEKETSLFVAIDKLEKIGEEKVREELRGQGFSDTSISTVFGVLNFSGTAEQKLAFLREKFAGTQTGTKGIQDLREVFDLTRQYGMEAHHIDFDITLARGLSYYTGCIFEVKIHGVAIGSVSGGGRYDNLTQAFGSKERLSGVGISFGIDRIYDALEELALFPKSAQTSTRVLVCHFDEASRTYGLPVVRQLREKGIAAEIYPDISKIKKQLEYADRKNIAYAIVIGSDEMASGQLTVKNLGTGEQQKKSLSEISAWLTS